jgi:undecaprenyl-diphosphatase
MNKAKAIVPVFLGNIHNLDVSMFRWVMKRKHLVLWARLCRDLSRTADGFAYPIVGLLLWYGAGAPGELFALTMAMAFALERPLYFVLKKGLKRNRPADALPNFQSFIIPSDQFSFPSGHTSGAFAIATGLALFFPDTTIIAYSWAALVGVSRVTLGVHFPTDTLAGALMGTLLTLFSGFWITQ